MPKARLGDVMQVLSKQKSDDKSDDKLVLKPEEDAEQNPEKKSKLKQNQFFSASRVLVGIKFIFQVGVVVASIASAFAQGKDEGHAARIDKPFMTGQQLKASFAPIVKVVAPAVVNILAEKHIKGDNLSPLLSDPVLKHLFGGMPQQGARSRVQNSLGSGVLVDAQGIVITNYHVIQAAEKIKVVLHDGREYAADVVVQDKRSDLVALKLRSPSTERFTYLGLQDSDEVQVGDIVLAFGNPFGFGNTVTSGIISGLSRSEAGAHDFKSFIQTDAAINPGNSGGPLVSMDGQIVGINTAIFSNTGGSIGISFAIPSNLVKPVLKSVKEGRKQVVRPWLGIQVAAIKPERAKLLGSAVDQGVLIQRIFSEGAAAAAGLQAGDIILKVGKYPVASEESLRFRIATFSVGMEVPFTIWRSGVEKVVPLKLIAPPEIPQNRTVRITGQNPLSGAVITGFSPSVAEEVGLFYDGNGVLVLKVQPASLAQLNGFRFGDIIKRINGHNVKTVPELDRYMVGTMQTWTIEFMRDGVLKIYDLEL